MPAPERYGGSTPGERASALAAVAVAQLCLGLALISGLRVDVARPSELVTRLISVDLPRVPPPVVRPAPRVRPVLQSHAQHRAPAPARVAPRPGGSLGPAPPHAAPAATLAFRAPPAAPAGGGTGAGASRGRGSGGAGGTGSGEDEGGTDLVQIAGAILPSDYPRRLRDAGIGGRVGVLFEVGANGRVTRCTVTRSSGVSELDLLTCRLIQQRFVYRPSTDESGRPVADEVEGEHDWVASRRD